MDELGRHNALDDSTMSNIVANSRSGSTTPSIAPKTELIKNVVSEMLHKVEKAAKVLDRARDLRLSVEEKSKNIKSSTSSPKSKSRRTSLDNNESGSLAKKKQKLAIKH